MKTKLLILTAFVFLNVLPVIAQQSEQINIKSLRVFYSGNEFEGALTYENSTQNIINFNGWTGYGLSYIKTEIRTPTTLDTNGFTNYGIISSASGGGGDYRYKFYLTASNSEPIVLRPTILRKKSGIVFIGATTLRGRVEVIDQRNLPSHVIAVDNDIVLTGKYRAEFTQCGACSIRTVRLQNISYNLTQTQ